MQETYLGILKSLGEAVDHILIYQNFHAEAIQHKLYELDILIRTANEESPLFALKDAVNVVNLHKGLPWNEEQYRQTFNALTAYMSSHAKDSRLTKSVLTATSHHGLTTEYFSDKHLITQMQKYSSEQQIGFLADYTQFIRDKDQAKPIGHTIAQPDVWSRSANALLQALAMNWSNKISQGFVANYEKIVKPINNYLDYTRSLRDVTLLEKLTSKYENSLGKVKEIFLNEIPKFPFKSKNGDTVIAKTITNDLSEVIKEYDQLPLDLIAGLTEGETLQMPGNQYNPGEIYNARGAYVFNPAFSISLNHLYQELISKNVLPRELLIAEKLELGKLAATFTVWKNRLTLNIKFVENNSKLIANIIETDFTINTEDFINAHPCYVEPYFLFDGLFNKYPIIKPANPTGEKCNFDLTLNNGNAIFKLKVGDNVFVYSTPLTQQIAYLKINNGFSNGDVYKDHYWPHLKETLRLSGTQKTYDVFTRFNYLLRIKNKVDSSQSKLQERVSSAVFSKSNQDKDLAEYLKTITKRIQTSYNEHRKSALQILQALPNVQTQQLLEKLTEANQASYLVLIRLLGISGLDISKFNLNSAYTDFGKVLESYKDNEKIDLSLLGPTQDYLEMKKIIMTLSTSTASLAQENQLTQVISLLNSYKTFIVDLKDTPIFDYQYEPEQTSAPEVERNDDIFNIAIDQCNVNLLANYNKNRQKLLEKNQYPNFNEVQNGKTPLDRALECEQGKAQDGALIQLIKADALDCAEPKKMLDEFERIQKYLPTDPDFIFGVADFIKHHNLGSEAPQPPQQSKTNSITDQPDLFGTLNLFQLIAHKTGFYNWLPWHRMKKIPESNLKILKVQEQQLNLLNSKFQDIKNKLSLDNQCLEPEILIHSSADLIKKLLKQSTATQAELDRVENNLDYLTRHIEKFGTCVRQKLYSSSFNMFKPLEHYHCVTELASLDMKSIKKYLL